MTSQEMKRFLNNEPSTSHWLKNAINTASQRDICDSISDVQYLVIFINKLARENNIPEDLLVK